MHIVLAGLSSLATMLAFVLIGLWLRRFSAYRGYSMFSFAVLAIVFVSGGLAAYGVANAHPLAGLFERGAIFGFIAWLLVVAWRLYPLDSME